MTVIPGPHPDPTPQLFAEGVVSGPGSDGSPTFTPSGNTMLFTRSAAQWTIILEAHRPRSGWTRPVPAAFSGEWPDSSPAYAPDGSYVIFQSTRPVEPSAAGGTAPHPVSNLWRVAWLASQWGRPTRLPDTVNIGHSIWKPSIQADGTLYFTSIDPKGNKRLYSSKFVAGAYQAAQPLPFSDGTTLDVDPEIKFDGTLLVFSSAGRIPGDSKDHLFIVYKGAGDTWGGVSRLRYAGDAAAGGSTDDEPRLGPDHVTLYFSSDRSLPVHFPRTHDQAVKDTERMDRWDNGNTNVWSFSIECCYM